MPDLYGQMTPTRVAEILRETGQEGPFHSLSNDELTARLVSLEMRMDACQRKSQSWLAKLLRRLTR